MYKLLLLIIFTCIWIWAAINPLFPHDWLLENYLVFVAVPFFILMDRYFRLSKISYTMITLFMIAHVIWSHYTYAEVPFGKYVTLTANTLWWIIWNLLGGERNSYDRLVHLWFWLCFVYPVREMFLRMVKVKGIWWYLLPISIMWMFGGVYEIIEWITAINVNEAAGSAFLWSQWDIWDAQKDILLAGLGGTFVMFVALIINLIYKKDFWSDMKSSFRLLPKDTPLGEVALQKMIQ